MSLNSSTSINCSPGGMLMPGRSFPGHDEDKDWHGYQGSLKDDEVIGTGCTYSTFFRELDVRTLRWWAVDPKTSVTPWESPYMIMGGNPIINTDILGDDWYKDKKGNIEYDPNKHKDSKYGKGESWLGETYETKNAKYNKNGTALFSNEKQGYKYMWDRANRHNKENAALITDGKLLVLPDYKNNEHNAYIDEYSDLGITQKSIAETGKFSTNNQSYDLLGFIHTHQDKSWDNAPSYGWGDKPDYWFAKDILNGKPSFVMSWDNNLYAFRVNSSGTKITIPNDRKVSEMVDMTSNFTLMPYLKSKKNGR